MEKTNCKETAWKENQEYEWLNEVLFFFFFLKDYLLFNSPESIPKWEYRTKDDILNYSYTIIVHCNYTYSFAKVVGF